MLERKARLAKEEEEERILEKEVRIFKARKGLSKRKKDEGTPRKRRRLEENHQKVQQAGKPDSVQNPETDETQSGGWKLAKLRARMATETEIVTKFLNEKKQLDEVLLDISRL